MIGPWLRAQSILLQVESISIKYPHRITLKPPVPLPLCPPNSRGAWHPLLLQLAGSCLHLCTALSLSLVPLSPLALGVRTTLCPLASLASSPGPGAVQDRRKRHEWLGLKGLQSLESSWGWSGHRRSSGELTGGHFRGSVRQEEGCEAGNIGTLFC